MSAALEALNPSGLPALLIFAAFAASMLQAITGIGFGVIAGPVLIAAMASAGAIQASVLLSFLIALLLAPSTIPRVNLRLLAPLLVGICMGTPLGALALLALSLPALKLCAAAIVGFMALAASGLLSNYPIFERDTMRRRIGVGGVCGILNAALAMPGPPVAAYATAMRFDKSTIQATTLVAFLLAYPVAFAFQALFVGLSQEAMSVTLRLLLPTAAGALTGFAAGRFVPGPVAKWTTIGFLVLSVILLSRG